VLLHLFTRSAKLSRNLQIYTRRFIANKIYHTTTVIYIQSLPSNNVHYTILFPFQRFPTVCWAAANKINCRLHYTAATVRKCVILYDRVPKSRFQSNEWRWLERMYRMNKQRILMWTCDIRNYMSRYRNCSRIVNIPDIW